MNMPRTALVTGAARRIGRAVALALAGDGWTVVVHYNRSADEARSVVREIEAAGGQSLALQADLSAETSVIALAAAAIEAVGPIGCLVNNASLFELDEAATATRQSWDAHMQVNLRAPFVLSQAVAAALPDDHEGLIVNVIDERVWNLTPHFLSYTLSKSGLWTLTRTLALAFAPRIRVNGIGPGPTLPSPRQSQQQFDRQAQLMPLGHGTTPAEIADAVGFLIRARSMTGQMLALDGGQHLGWAQAGADPSVPE